MTLYKELREQYGQSSCEDKLKTLRYEMIPNISAVLAYAALLQKQVDPNAVQGLPDNFSEWLEGVTKAGGNLRDILDALTDDRERTSL